MPPRGEPSVNSREEITHSYGQLIYIPSKLGRCQPRHNILGALRDRTQDIVGALRILPLCSSVIRPAKPSIPTTQPLAAHRAEAFCSSTARHRFGKADGRPV